MNCRWRQQVTTVPSLASWWALPQGFSVEKVVVKVDESVRKEDGSDNEEKDENVEDIICQLLDQRTVSQCRDKSCAPSH